MLYYNIFVKNKLNPEGQNLKCFFKIVHLIKQHFISVINHKPILSTCFKCRMTTKKIFNIQSFEIIQMFILGIFALLSSCMDKNMEIPDFSHYSLIYEADISLCLYVSSYIRFKHIKSFTFNVSIPLSLHWKYETFNFLRKHLACIHGAWA